MPAFVDISGLRSAPAAVLRSLAVIVLAASCLFGAAAAMNPSVDATSAGTALEEGAVGRAGPRASKERAEERPREEPASNPEPVLPSVATFEEGPQPGGLADRSPPTLRGPPATI